MKYEEVKIVCVDGYITTLNAKNIKSCDLDYCSSQIVRFDFNDGSFMEFTRRNIIFIKFK
jgi:hypothetical protein